LYYFLKRDELDKKRSKLTEFRILSENLHHLVSTKQIRGVFNPPEKYLEVILNDFVSFFRLLRNCFTYLFFQTPTVDNVPVDEHIRGAVKDLLRSKGYKKKGMTADMNGSLKIPYKGLKSKLSLQVYCDFRYIFPFTL